MTLERLFGTWFLLAVAMTMNGAFREIALRRWMPGFADAASAVLGTVIILAVSRLGFRRFATATTGALVQSAIILVALTVAFETAIGRLVDGKSWDELAAHYAFWRGDLWSYLLALLALTPFVWGRWLAQDARAR